MKFILTVFFCISTAFAADLPALKELFIDNYNHFYQPRYCGKNINRLVEEANKRNIDLSNAYVMKIVGGGFLETSAFYARNNSNERVMIGYFHMVLIAEGHVFDFDLDEPIVPTTLDYIRLQFTPPYLPFSIFGIRYDPKNQLTGWKLTRFEWQDYINGKEVPTWTTTMERYIDLDELMSKPRIR